MATCSFIREKKQTAGAMGGVLRYVAQEQKTVDTDGTRYLTGINCAADLAYQSFLATKNLYGKARGTWFYHYVQSFPPQERVTPAEAHQIAQELAERFFPDCEVLVANGPMERATSEREKMAAGRGGTPPGTTPRPASGSSGTCWVGPRRRSRKN